MALRCTDCDSLRLAIGGPHRRLPVQEPEIVSLVVEGPKPAHIARDASAPPRPARRPSPRWPTSSRSRTARSPPSSSSATRRSRPRWRPGQRSRERLRRTQEALGSGRPLGSPALRCHAPARRPLRPSRCRSCDRLRPHGAAGATRPSRRSISPSGRASSSPSSGPTGCGKSTLLNAAAGLRQALGRQGRDLRQPALRPQRARRLSLPAGRADAVEDGARQRRRRARTEGRGPGEGR